MASKEKIYAGMSEIAWPAALFSLMGVLGGGGLFAISAWATNAEIAQNWEWLNGWPQRLNQWAIWIGVGTGAYLAIVLLLARYPLRAARFWRPTDSTRFTRKPALKLARRWKKIADACFNPIKDEGIRHYPGLKSVRPTGEGEFEARLRLPDVAGKTDQLEWLEKGATQLRRHLGVKLVEVPEDEMLGNQAVLRVIVLDLTTEAREVEL